MPRVENQVHDRNDKEGHKGADGEAADEGFGDGLDGVGAGAGEEGNGDHAENSGKAGHQYRAQAVTARFKAGFAHF